MKTTNSSQESEKMIQLYPSKLFRNGDDTIQNWIASDTYVRGLILGHCDQLQHPVVIMQKNTEGHECVCENQKDECDNSQFCNKGKYSRIESRLFYTHWADFCRKIRKSQSQSDCCRQDEMVADYLLSNLESLKSQSSVTISDNDHSVQAKVSVQQDNDSPNRHVLLRYECPISHYDELAININVEGIEGVLIIGQFFFRGASNRQINDFTETAKKQKIDNSRIQEITTQNAEDFNTVKKTVFNQVTEIEKALKNAYLTRVTENARVLQNRFVETFLNNYDAKKQQIPTKLNPIEICSAQYDCAVSAFGKALSELTNSLETSRLEEVLYALPKGLYEKSEYVIWQNEKIVSETEVPQLYSAIREVCHTDIQDEFLTLDSGYHAYCIPLVSGQKKYIYIIAKNSLKETVQDILKEIMAYVCLKITELQAKFNEAQIKAYTMNMRHELGQLNDAVLVRISGFEARVSEASLYLRDDRFIQECVHMLDDYRSFTHTTMLRNNASKYFSEIPELTRSYFYPYETFLFKWRYIYSRQAENKNIRFIMDSVERNDQSRPRMYADISMIEQVAYNLTNNAFKYSIPGSTITLDCRLNEDRTFYQIVVSSFGWPIEQDEKEKIFLYGFRGKNNKEREGSGIGLYLSRRIAEEHGGSLELFTETVSPFDVSCLFLYEDMPERFQDLETRENVRTEIDRLRHTVYSQEIHKPILKNNAFTPYYIQRYIDKGTMRYTFVLSIPFLK